MLSTILKPSKKNIFITAGHGGIDPGAVGNGYKEADLTLELRDLIVAELKDKYTVFTDVNDHSLSKVLTWLRSLITANVLLVDIHFNASINALATGTEVLVPDNCSILESKLATSLSINISKLLGLKNRFVKKESQSARGKIGILNIPAENILIEVCFISNKADVEAYQKNKALLAKEIANTIKVHY